MDALEPTNNWMAVLLCGIICCIASIPSPPTNRKWKTKLNDAAQAFVGGCILCCLLYDVVSYSMILGLSAVAGISGPKFIGAVLQVIQEMLLSNLTIAIGHLNRKKKSNEQDPE